MTRAVLVLVLVLVVLTWSGLGRAAEPWAPEVRIVEYGVYRIAGKTDLDGGPFGPTGLSKLRGWVRPRLVERTDRVEARPCLHFGIRFAATNLPGLFGVSLVARITHPPFVRPDGMTGSVESWTTSAGPGLGLIGFTFDEPWEMVPGPWRIEVSSEGKMLAEPRFDGVATGTGGAAAPGRGTPTS